MSTLHADLAVEREQAPSPPYRWPALVALFGVPGVATVAWALAVGPLFGAAGLPAAFGISVSPLVILAELAFLLVLGYRRNGRLSLDGIVGFRRRLPGWRLVAVCGSLYLVIVGLYLALQPLHSRLAPVVSDVLPDALTGDAADARHSTAALVFLVVGNFLFNGLVHPTIEELYFRGHLLPRMPLAGAAAVLANAALFSVQHFWQPHLFLFVFLAQVVMQWALLRCGDLRISIVAHCAINLTGGLLTLLAYLSA